MKEFVARFASLVTAMLSGFDRLVFRGYLLPLMRDRGMHVLLHAAGVRLLEFRKYVLDTTELLKEATLAAAEEGDRPIRYLESPAISKEDLARTLLAEHPIDEGLICVFKAVEPCRTFEYRKSQDPKERGLRLRANKCLHLYKYFLHPRFGFMNARIQTWFPFNVQVCLNGREWLARELEARGRSFKRVDNCFTWLDDPRLAQRLMNRQLATDWSGELEAIARELNPAHDTIFEPWPMNYYWSAYQTEWATDLMFNDPRALASIYPSLVDHAMRHFKSPDVMRFLARKAHGNFTGEITSGFKDRAEGVRVKHWVRGNSVKMYDKAGSILRLETTIARPDDFKVFRPRQDDPDGTLEWRPLRKGVADLHRRAELSQQSNSAYLGALSVVEDTTPCAEIFDGVSRPVTYAGRRARALRLNDAKDVDLLQAISRGEFAVAGFRNRDIRRLLFPGSDSAKPWDLHRAATRVSYQLRLLRAHGLIRKVQKSHRYRLTKRGRLLTMALFATRTANVKELLDNAA